VNFLYFSVFLENLYDTESMIANSSLSVVARLYLLVCYLDRQVLYYNDMIGSLVVTTTTNSDILQVSVKQSIVSSSSKASNSYDYIS
jgi:hypothetical protein